MVAKLAAHFNRRHAFEVFAVADFVKFDGIFEQTIVEEFRRSSTRALLDLFSLLVPGFGLQNLQVSVVHNIWIKVPDFWMGAR